MVVEDEAVTADVVAAALADEGYCVVAARDGQAALQMVQRAPPDGDVSLTLVRPCAAA
jgi:CheY-like chemotaxis protein